jgi:hypothetical protein
MPAVLVATWSEGLFVIAGGVRLHELANHSVAGLAPDGHGGALAIVDKRSLSRRAGGVWTMIATADVNLDGNLYVSTDSAHSWSRHAAGLPSPSGVLVV